MRRIIILKCVNASYVIAAGSTAVDSSAQDGISHTVSAQPGASSLMI